MQQRNAKEVIADAALELFSRKGFESVGVNEIVEKAEITKPSLYYYFGSKEGLLISIVETQGEELLRIIRNASEYRHDLVMNLRSLFDGVVDFACAHRAFFRLLLRLFASAPETPGYETGFALRSNVIDLSTDLFVRASSDHGNMRQREKIYAETFWGLLETYSKLAMNGEINLDPPVRHRVVHQYMHGIFS